VFRERDRSELESRCSDVIVHWTSEGDEDGPTRQRTTGLCLVSGLEGKRNKRRCFRMNSESVI
jgi:hypothetical protein